MCCAFQIRSVADSLKSGSAILPELYKEVTIYFSDIVSFTTLASESTPMEVVDFLNDLWTVFDDIINKFNVYKVELLSNIRSSRMPIGLAGVW